MARRGRRKQLTYDSRETRSVLGLLSLLAAITLFIAVIVDANEANFFSQVRQLFGQTTIFAAIFCFNLGLRLFNSPLPFASSGSVLAQFILTLLLPAFVTSLYTSKADAIVATREGLAGGQTGYILAYELFADTLVFGQYTPLLLGLACLIFVPVALSMSVARLVEVVGTLFSWLAAAIRSLFAHREKLTQLMDVPENAKRFGDFQRKGESDLTSRADQRAKEMDKPQPKQESHPDVGESNVAIKEQEIGENGLSQEQLNYPNWQLPPITLLAPYKKVKPKDTDTEWNAEVIKRTLASFKIDAEVVDAFIGPSVVRFALSIPLGIPVGKIANLSATLALGLGVDSKSVRVDTIPGTTYLGIEVPRKERDFVQIREMMESDVILNGKSHLPLPVGKDIDGSPIVTDLQSLPHLLIAGATGSGKSILTNSFIISTLMKRTPDELRMILVDPKQVELMDYNGIPHLLTPVITEMDKVKNALGWAVAEMERRYTVMAHTQVRNITEYNKKLGFAAMPFIMIVIDEMADMMMTSSRAEVENAIVRLTQKARAVGIHMILATQRPSVNVITGLIKANVPARVGMSVASNTDSRVILDNGGAESLMGKGDLLYNSPGQAKMMRLQGPFVTGEEIIRVVNFIKSQVPEVTYITSILEDRNARVDGEDGGDGEFSDDNLFFNAIRTVAKYQKGSASFLQRRLNVGFNRAARLLEELEAVGAVGPQLGSKPREVLVVDAESFIQQLKSEGTE